jgi:hypothetical protein
MAYVYDRVSKDPQSHQTPHYGHVDGDGDLIFSAPQLAQLPSDVREGVDVLVAVPASLSNQEFTMRTPLDLAKEFLSDSRFRIQLDELVTEHLRQAIAKLDPTQLPLDLQPVNADSVAKRLADFDSALGDLPHFVALMARWGGREHLATFTKVFARLADAQGTPSGYDGWIGLRWLPFDTLMYAAGISAISAGNWSYLAALYEVRSVDRMSYPQADLAFVRAANGLMSDANGFLKRIPEHERQYVPRSEYQFKHIQPLLDDLHFLGSSYEDLFDRFEVLHALAYVAASESSYRWGPPGRFAWKFRNSSNGPLVSIAKEGTAAGSSWGPFAAGMFGGSPELYAKACEEYIDMIRKANWF